MSEDIPSDMERIGNVLYKINETLKEINGTLKSINGQLKPQRKSLAERFHHKSRAHG